MAYEDFSAAFTADFMKERGVTDASQLDEVNKTALRFGLSSNERASQILDMLAKRYSLEWQGLRVLDVGCAYGGICIESAKRGALSYGVDIEEKWIEYARINAEGLPIEVNFYLLDACSRSMVKELPRSFFDLIVLNDSFEHIYDTVGLLKNLQTLARPNCKMYFAIPNGWAISFIEREGHTGTLGTSILNPFLWRYQRDSGVNIFYRRWDYYVALLNHFGFREINLMNYPARAVLRRQEAKKEVIDGIEAIKKAIDDYSREEEEAIYRNCLKVEFGKIEQEMLDDLQALDAVEIDWKYVTTFWTGVAIFEGPKTEARWLSRLFSQGGRH